ncbi:hypothetical protein [Wolbachia endosymbiont (group B) of Euphydryas aurinia]|nr:hypothetical protein [Wolbachia endosymbiont (group B) of Euphydryas aurinia]
MLYKKIALQALTATLSLLTGELKKKITVDKEIKVHETELL